MNLTIAVTNPHVIPIVQSRIAPLVFEVGDLAFNDLEGSVKKHGQRIPLSPMRYKMLLSLARHAYKGIEQPLSKRALMCEVYGDNSPDSNSFDVQMWRLRRALGKAKSALVVQNFYGSGFKLAVPKQ